MRLDLVRRLLPAVALLVATAACGYLDGPDPQPTQLTIVNTTNATITSASARFCDWSEESDYRPLILEGFDQLAAGDSRDMAFAAGCYDLRAILSDGTVVEIPDARIPAGAYTWRITR